MAEEYRRAALNEETSTQTMEQQEVRNFVASEMKLGMVILAAQGEVPRTIEVKQKIGIGRQADQLLYIQDKELSRRHAELSQRAQELFIKDLGSHNGTFLNSRKIDVDVSIRLQEQDILRCGNTIMMMTRTLGDYLGWPMSADQPPLCGGKAMGEIRKRAEICARSGFATLINGPSGSGKEVVARLMHEKSERKGDFIAVNCAAIPEALFEAELFGAKRGAFTGATVDRPGLIEVAEGGTLFLDEIGELPLSLQPKLLRALELGEVRAVGSDHAKRVNINLITATHRTLEHEIDVGRFREDLYHRICAAKIEIPPLASRREDIAFFAERILKQLEENSNRVWGMDVLYLESLLLRSWSGNLRQLEHVINESIVSASISRPDTTILLLEDLPKDSYSEIPTLVVGDSHVDLKNALRNHQGNVSAAADALKISRSRIYQLMADAKIKAADFRSNKG